MTEYLSCAATAKLIRAQLKAKFPGIKFGVRSSVYAGGASIDVVWTDGPTGKMVDAVVKPFEGGGFDGMIDMAYSVYAYLLPDGSAAFAQTSGTEGSAGTVPADKAWMPVAGAKRVHFGANYVFTTRKMSRAMVARALAAFQAKWGEQAAGMKIAESYDGSAYVTDVPREIEVVWRDALNKRVAPTPAMIAA